MISKSDIDSLTCFVCPSTGYQECTFVAECKPNEDCFIDKFVHPDGNVTFQRGCRETSACPNHRHPRDSIGGMVRYCTECCNTEHCNYGGCGRPGLPSRHLRGPLCYNCFEQQTEGGCNRVNICGRDQRCKIQISQYALYSTAYTTGCIEIQTCNRILPPPVGRRDMDSKRTGRFCFSCCDEDLCNKNCSILHRRTTSLTSVYKGTTISVTTTTTTVKQQQ